MKKKNLFILCIFVYVIILIALKVMKVLDIPAIAIITPIGFCFFLVVFLPQMKKEKKATNEQE